MGNFDYIFCNQIWVFGNHSVCFIFSICSVHCICLYSCADVENILPAGKNYFLFVVRDGSVFVEMSHLYRRGVQFHPVIKLKSVSSDAFFSPEFHFNKVFHWTVTRDLKLEWWNEHCAISYFQSEFITWMKDGRWRNWSIIIYGWHVPMGPKGGMARAFLDRPTTTGRLLPLALHCSSCSAHEKAAADASYDVAAAKGRWKQGPPFLI